MWLRWRLIFGTSGDSKYTYHWVNYSDVNLALQNGTPPKFNMEPKNTGFQMDFPFPGTYFQVPC